MRFRLPEIGILIGLFLLFACSGLYTDTHEESGFQEIVPGNPPDHGNDDSIDPLPTPTVGAQCGNHVIEAGEVCECGVDGTCGTNDDLLQGISCTHLGAVSGTLRCASSCAAWDVHACIFSDRVRFVDHRLTAACVGNYSIGNRACNGTDGDAYPQVKKATAVVSPGETILVREGTYNEYDISFAKSGLPDAPITIAGYPGDAGRPIIQQTQGFGGGRPGFVFGDFSEPEPGNFVVKNLIIRNANHGILFISSNAAKRIRNVRIEDCELYNFSGSGIRAQSFGVERLYVKNVTIHDTLSTEGGLDFKVNTLAFAPGNASQRVIIRDVVTYNNRHPQASGFIAQESTQNFILINNLTHHNGEIGFASKAGGHNIYINNTAYDQSKASYYLRGPKKDFGNGDFIDGKISNYLLLNNIGIGRKIIEGDQGPIQLWQTASAWMYGNSLIGMKANSTTAFFGAPFTILAGDDSCAPCTYGDPLFAFAKNNIGYQAYNIYFATFHDNLLHRTYRGAGNLFKVADKPETETVVRFHGFSPGNVGFEGFRNYFSADADSIYADPGFSFFDRTQDEILQNLRPTFGSYAIDQGSPYGGSDPDDYPQKVEEFLTPYSSTGNPNDAFDDFDLLTDSEKTELRELIRTAYRFDRDGNPRINTPDAGAFEISSKPFLAGSLPRNGAHLRQFSSITFTIADNREGDLDIGGTIIESAIGPGGASLTYIKENAGSGSLATLTLSNIPDLGDGTYRFAILVRDLAGNSQRQTVRVVVDRQAPKAVITSVVQAPRPNRPYWTSLDGNSSRDNEEIVLYEWDMNGDGTYDLRGFGFDGAMPMADYNGYPGPGTYHVILRVTDRAGNQSVSTPYIYSVI